MSIGLKAMVEALSGYYSAKDITKAYDNVIKKVEVTNGIPVLYFDNGNLKIDLYGDCCSQSYYTPEALEEFKSMVGSKIIGGELVDGEEFKKEYGDVTRQHFLKFVTDKGHVTIDWRNDSNGYYDGSIEATWSDS